MTLKKWMNDLGAPPSERWLRALATPLAQAISVLHEHSTLHRDLSPDNVLMLYDRATGNYLEQAPRPVLLDFGAARRVAAEATQQLTAILKSGYSPVEQYDNDAKERQGPWTDVYALAAVMYHATAGKAPPASIARAVRDDMVPARVAAAGRYSQAFLQAIDRGLAVRAEQRPQSMAELLAWFDAPEPLAPPAGTALAAAPSAGAALADAGAARRRCWPLLAAAGASAGLIALLAWLVLR
jgi:serine/threonine protein kinase